MDAEAIQDYVCDLVTTIKMRAREAQKQKEKSSGTDLYDFNLGFLAALAEVVSLIRSRAQAFNIDPEEINAADIDPDRDLR